MSVDQDIKNSSEQLKADVSLTHQIVHGDDTTEVMTEGGPVPSWAKVGADGRKEVSAQLQPTVNDINDHAELVIAEADRSKAEADRSGSYVQGVADEGAAQLQAVASKGAEQVSAVNTAGSAQVQAINTAGTDRIAEIETAGQSAEAAADRAQGIADKFGDVDSAVTQARTEADRSTAEANKATSANNSAQSAKSAAEQAKNDATAIVHNDEGSLTSKPGAYPVADSKGHLDINWTPLLAAMYPYSGVIGSVDKGDIFYFTPTDGWQNIIRLVESRYNIAGRFVHIPATTRITLPEAESTAGRAVAFDDIFLDWNGQVQTYRSITAHRTVTGYDRDAIATEHGYSKVQTGLYKQGDTYVLLLGRVARRNKGAYHPVFNPEGSSPFRKYNVRDLKWTDPEAICNSLSDAFIFTTGPDNDFHAHPDKGNLSSGISGRPDNKFHDAIYDDDFTPLYYSAKNVVDRKALLDDSFNRAVAGETFMAAEACDDALVVIPEVFTVTRNWSWNPANANGSLDVGTSSSSRRDISPIGDSNHGVWLVGPTGTYKLDYNYGSEGTGGGSSKRIYAPHTGGTCYFYSRGSSTDRQKLIEMFPVGATFQIVYANSKKHSACPQFLMVDIIGSLDAMPDEWKTNGIPGNWLAVGEEGNSLIPDGTQKNYKLSRKCLDCYQVLKTEDKGITWQDTPPLTTHFESASNAMNHNPSADTCYMVFYRTSANPFELADDTSVDAIGDYTHVLHWNDKSNSLCASNLIGKVPVNTTSPLTETLSIKSLPFDLRHGALRRLDSTFGYLTHEPINAGTTTLPAVKTVHYLNDGGLYIIYKEMKHNGSSWGDDSKFDIVGKQSSVTDLNGEQVIVGQKRVELPYQFDGVTY